VSFRPRRIADDLVGACGSPITTADRQTHVETNLRILSRRLASEFGTGIPCVAGDLFIAVSQSASTADTIAAMREARSRGAPILSICNVLGSTLAREADNAASPMRPGDRSPQRRLLHTQIAVLFLILAP
jgi:glucosamine 6-phosphate synthetase-like amidotransferase/phosphosugar isomerase protein